MTLRLAFSIILTSLSVGCSLLGHGTVVFQGTSMLPTLKDGDRLQIMKLDSGSRKTLVRGDIVVFKAPMDTSKSYIKRVIGLPGDRIEIRGGSVA